MQTLCSVSLGETLHKARLTALHAICLQIFRHIAQKSLARRLRSRQDSAREQRSVALRWIATIQFACGISMQSAEKIWRRILRTSFMQCFPLKNKKANNFCILPRNPPDFELTFSAKNGIINYIYLLSVFVCTDADKMPRKERVTWIF